MQQIDFHFNVPNRSLYACRLIKKVHAMGKRIVVWGSDEPALKKTFDDLWRFEDMTFIAHAWAGSDYEGDCSVIFSNNLDALPDADVIVLLDDNVPEDWASRLARFERAVDIVSTRPDELAAARARYRVYRDAGVTPKAYDRSRSNG